MVLKRVHTDPEYQELADWILTESTRRWSSRRAAGSSSECYIVISSPNSSVPSHFDPEYNLLFQIQGTKDVTVGTFPDLETERAEAERYYGGGHRNISELPANARRLPDGPRRRGAHPAARPPHGQERADLLDLALDLLLHAASAEVGGRLLDERAAPPAPPLAVAPRASTPPATGSRPAPGGPFAAAATPSGPSPAAAPRRRARR